MNSHALALSGALGGLAVFIGGVWAVVRGIVRQTDTTRANTQAVRDLTQHLDRLAGRVDENSRAIARLEGRRR